MRYPTNADLQARNASLSNTNDNLRVHLTRLLVILSKKHSSESEQRTIELAMKAALVTPEHISSIRAGHTPWPKTR
jgi:hypothetical protein